MSLFVCQSRGFYGRRRPIRHRLAGESLTSVFQGQLLAFSPVLQVALVSRDG